LKELKTKIKIAVSLLQVMQMVPGVLPFIEWPSVFLGFLNAMGIFNLSIFQVLQADCIHPNNFYDRLLLHTLLPMSVWAVLGLSCGVHTLRQKAEDRGETVSGYIGAALLVAYLSLPLTSNTIFDTFKCEAFDAGSGNRRNFLASDLRLDCDTDTHRNFQIYAGVMAVVYPIGIPIWMAANLYRHRGAIAPPVNFYEMSRAQTEWEQLSAGMSMRAKLQKTLSKTKGSLLGNQLSNQLETNAPASDNSDPVLKLVSLETGRQYRGFLNKDSKEWAGMKKREDDSSIQHLIFIYDDYKPSCLYFEVFESMRKVFLSAVLAILDANRHRHPCLPADAEDSARLSALRQCQRGPSGRDGSTDALPEFGLWPPSLHCEAFRRGKPGLGFRAFIDPELSHVRDHHCRDGARYRLWAWEGLYGGGVQERSVRERQRGRNGFPGRRQRSMGSRGEG